MQSPTAQIKLPEIPLSQSARSSPTNRPSGGSLKILKSTRPKATKLARKIDDDELFGDTLKFTHLGLSQIAEERVLETEEFDGLMGSQVEFDEAKEPKVKNIFQKESLVSSKYKEVEKGPSYDDDGTMVKHSIIGSVDMYERYHRNLKKHILKESTGTSFDKDNLSASEKSFSMRLLNVAGSGSFKLDQTPTSHSHARLNTQNSMIVGKKAVSSENKKVKKDLRVSKQDILKKIDRFREIQAQFYEDEKNKTIGLTHGDKLHHTKEERCLQEYDKVVNNWNDTIDKITNKIHRTAGKSVMLRGDDFREKIEQAEAFDIVQTDQERFGTMFWYMNLRNEKKKGGAKEKNQMRVIHDIPYGFSCPQIVRPASSLEVIRKPVKLNQSNAGIMLPPIHDVRYLDRTKDEYLLERSTMLESELSKVMTSQIGDTNELIVEGKNKLEIEVEAFFNVNRGKEVFVAPKNFFEEKPISLEEEYIAVHYDGKEIIKNGLSAFVK